MRETLDGLRAEYAGAAAIVGRHDLALGIDIGDVGEGLVAEPVLGQHRC